VISTDILKGKEYTASKEVNTDKMLEQRVARKRYDLMTFAWNMRCGEFLYPKFLN
jgi:hypothetical protein